MAVAESHELKQYCLSVAERARHASGLLVQVPGQIKDRWLRHSAVRLRDDSQRLMDANLRDLQAAPEFGLTEAQIDRLRLSPAGIDEIAAALEQIAMLPSPIGEVIHSSVRPNGLRVDKVRVPLGVVFFVYESRPNVTADAAAICVKSGNAVILRGGKEAAHSSRAIVDILTEVGETVGLPAGAIQLVEPRDRQAVSHFLQLDRFIDVAIPRGGEGLIRRVVAEAKMPVIKHFAGNCHVYVDQHADVEMAIRITVNAKCQRMGVCNAAESLVVHTAIADRFLPRLASQLQAAGIELRGDARTRQWIPNANLATDEDYATEFLGPVLSIRLVDSLQEAIDHIQRFGSGHTDAIVSDSVSAVTTFTSAVDSSAVMVNASTRFNDGGQFGLGAEIGISTDKFHARGPCGLNELTSYKYIVYGQGQIRE